MGKSIIIIGAGIGGLSTGVYARYCGLYANIYEMHNLPGGQCTSWKRNDYVFDGSIHHLAGCKEGTLLYKMWEELGAMPAKCIFPEEMVSIEDQEGNKFTAYYDLDKLEKEMTRIAPEDKKIITEYINGIKKFKNLDLLEIGLWKFGSWMKNIFKFLKIAKWTKISVEEYSQKFKNPIMKKFFSSIQYNWKDIPMMLHLNMMAAADQKKYGWYRGGSLEFSKAIENKFLQLGGKIHFNTKILKIITEKGRAVGVKLENGEEHFADYIVSNAFNYETMMDLLEGKYIDEKMKGKFKTPGEDMKMGIHVAFGINRNISKEPHAINLFLNSPIEIACKKNDCLSINLYGFDPSMAPENKGVIKILYDTEYSYWKNLYDDKKKYNEEKRKIADITLDALEKRFKGIKDQVEVFDVATPITTERFTGNGRPYGLDMDIDKKEMTNMILNKPKKLEGLENFFMVGQSYGGAGIPGCAGMGRNIIKKICKRQEIKFKKTLPK